MEKFPSPYLASISMRIFSHYLFNTMGFPGGSVVKNPRAMQERWVRSLSRENPLEKEMGTHSSVLAWRIPGTGEPDGLPSMGLHRVGHD